MCDVKHPHLQYYKMSNFPTNSTESTSKYPPTSDGVEYCKPNFSMPNQKTRKVSRWAN